MAIYQLVDPNVVMDKMGPEEDEEKRSRIKVWLGRLGWIVAALLSLVLLYRFRSNIVEVSNESLEQLETLKGQLANTLGGTNTAHWEGVENLFIFGDSYTSTGDFWHLPSKPTADNPRDEDGHFRTAPNWVDFLTSTYNHTEFKAYNFAAGGSTVDDTVVQPYLIGTSLKRQIAELFLPDFADEEPQYRNWKPENSLFLTWFGINDLHMHFMRAPSERPPLATIFDSYADRIQELYAVGARNFLFLTVPPFDRATRVVPSPNDLQKYVDDLNFKLEEIADIEAYNARIFKMRRELRNNYTDVSAYIFDTHAFFARILETPEQFPQMDTVTNTRGICYTNENGDPYYNATCGNGSPLSSHAWVPLHATYPVHNATAARIAQDCFSKQGKRGFCL